ncbi:MAG: serpin family protein [Bacteroidaceae bacterium]|nr:serpin family protein [Bacteroidaceae bacterium]
MKRLFFLLTVLAVSLSVFADEVTPKSIQLTDEERQFVNNNNRFALNLFQKARADESLLLSPLGITFDLGMLNNGADGITREEIDAVLGSEGVGGADAINAFCRKLLTESATLDETTRIAIANNIYVNSASGCYLLPAFVETAQQYYDATPESRDFGDGVTRDVMNQWGSDHTEGMIEEAIREDEFYPEAVSYLLNALYFKGEWTHKFNAGETQRCQFDEGRKEAQIMYQHSDFSYAANNVYQSVILPYGNKAYQMTVFLPRWGKTIGDVLAYLKSKGWSKEDYGACHVDLYMPKFETATDIRLEDIMKSLGMPNAFGGGYGFNQFCNMNAYIGMMKQAARIKLDEEGTEASAVTVIETRKYDAPDYAEFVADRPFLYIISEQSTGAIFFIGQYMGEEPANPRKEIELSGEERQLVESNNNFAFNLFQTISNASKEESFIVSPLSITFALGMINNGAAGQTQQEINEVLGFGDAGADAINQFCRKLLTEAPTLDKTTAAEIANTIFVNSGDGYELQQGFIDKANAFYDAEPQALNFREKEQTLNTINQWANDHTHGVIPEVLDENSFREYAVSYLLNALYFKGAWTNKFDATYTREEPFNGGATVPMMQQWESYQYTENNLYQTVRLPYGNEAYQMTIFLPREDKTINDVLATVNGASWKSEQYRTYDVDLKLPRIKTGTNLPLVEVMKEMGMPAAFDETSAEFPYFCNQNVYISDMFQKAAIDLDEEGTEAAAVTVGGATSTGMPRYVTFHADRPFLYIISEQSTGVIFFIGQYAGPDTAASISLAPALPKEEGAIYNLAGQIVNSKLSNSKLPRGIYILNGKKILR